MTDTARHTGVQGHPPRCDLEIDMASPDKVVADAREVIAKAKPHWDQDRVVIRSVTGGTTNKLLSCEDPQTGDRMLLRIYGPKTELIIDRLAEVDSMGLLHAYGFAPEVFLVFGNGLCYGYLDGEALTVEQVSEKTMSRKIARHMATMHAKVPVGQNESARIVPMMKRYVELVPADVLASAERDLEGEFGAGRVDIRVEIERLSDVYSRLDQTVVFCHNDLFAKNILADGDRVHFIDYEYACVNYQGFDIGNFFVEFGGHGAYDRSRYPTREWQLAWIRDYLDEYRMLRGLDPATAEDVETLYIHVNKCALASGLVWGVWALIQAANSTIDFDFKKLALDRLGMYFAKRDELLSL